MTGKYNLIQKLLSISFLVLILLCACSNEYIVPAESTTSIIEDQLSTVIEAITIAPTETKTVIPNDLVPTETPLPIIDSSKLLLVGFKEEKWEVYLISLPCWDLNFSCSLEYDNQLLVDLREYWYFGNLNISPSGEKALFVSDIRDPNRNGDLYVTKLGSPTYRLISTAESIGYAIWSPDNYRIAFVSNIEGKHLTQLHIVSEDGNNDTLLPTPNEINTYPSWSRSGEKIAFYSRGEKTGNKDYLYTIDLKTKEITKLTDIEVSATTLPRWSPDGKKIAFLVKESNQEDICIVNTQTLVRECFYSKDSWDTSPSFSPDNSKISYSSNHDLHGSGIFVRDLETGKETKISRYEGFYSEPLWAPSGHYIACEVLIDEQWYPYLIAGDGSWEIQLADADFDIYANQFLP